MPKYLLPIFCALAIMGAGCGSSQQPSVAQPNSNQPASSNPATASTAYTLDDVAQHATANDCWITISDKVYDMTSYIPNHPGGDKILDGCGKDATDMFVGIKGGQGHSDYAKSLMSDYYKGDLKQ